MTSCLATQRVGKASKTNGKLLQPNKLDEILSIMFEHSIYEPEPVATPTQEGDLFHNYEIKNWDLSKRIYQILGVSAAVNLLALLVFSTTSVLTMKGCDSPLVGNVCQVLDTIYVGSKLFGTDREYVNAVYDKTELGDADVTFVDVSGETPPISYPEGYFQIANPEQFLAQVEQANNPPIDSGFIAPGIPITQPSTGSTLIDTPQRLPKVNSNPIDGDLPSGFGDAGSNPTTRKGRRGGRVKPPVPDQDDTADKKPSETPEPLPTPMSSEAVTAVDINKKPLADFADDIVTKWDAKEVDLNQPFVVVLNGVLTKEGKLDAEKSKFDLSKQKGDQKMIDVAKAAIQAVGDSGFLTYLRSLDVEKVTITLIQDDKQLTAVISSSQKTSERANVISSGIGGYISLGKLKYTDPNADERKLLDGAKATADGKNFVLNFAIPKPVAQEMITRRLKEAQAKKQQQPQPNSGSINKPNNNTAKK